MQDMNLVTMPLRWKKTATFILLTLSLMLGVAQLANAQTEVRQLNASMIPANGRVSHSGTFQIDVSITYNTDINDEYELTLELPADVDWSRDYASDGTFTIDKEAITLSGTTYTIPVQVMSPGSKGANLLLQGFVSNIAAGQCADIHSPIHLAIAPDLGIGAVEKEITLITPRGPGSNPSFTTTLLQNQEKDENNTDNGHFPFYVDVRLGASAGIATLPTVSLAYNDTKLDFIRAVLYDEGLSVPLFHTEVLGSGLINDAGGAISIELVPGTTYNFSSPTRVMRFYFKALDDVGLIPDDVVLSATGAEYIPCGSETEMPLLVADKKINAATLKESVADLYPSFRHKHNTLTLCRSNCDFSPGTFSSDFYFEIDNIVTGYGITGGPVVQVECPAEVANMVSLKVTPAQYPNSMPVIEYITSGSGTPQVAVYADGLYTFGTDNPTVIYIKNYADGGDGHAWDFAIRYTLKTAELASVPIADKQFRLSYGDSFRNSKVYASSAISINQENNCKPGLRFEDAYELNDLSGFATSGVVNYPPGARRNIRIQIQPENIKYSAVYTISRLQYVLNSNMEFDVSNLRIFYSTTGANGSWQQLSYGQSLEFYKDIRVVQKADGRTLEISFTMYNTDPEKCGQAKPLYLMVPVHVRDNAVFSSGNHKSSLSSNSWLSPPFEPRPWNVQLGSFDKLSASLSVICPGDRQAMSQFEKGQLFTVRYILNNENQNAVNTLDFMIKDLVYAVREQGGPNHGISIRSQHSSALLNGHFTISAEPSGLRIKNTSGRHTYELGGNDRLYIDIRYRLEDDLTPGTREEDITFQLTSYTSGNDVARTTVKPAILGLVEVVEKSSCLPQPPCENCVTSFSPLPGEEYLLSAWVKESYNTDHPQPASYRNAAIRVAFNDGDIDRLELFRAGGPVIDGWQRIERSFTVPEDAYNILIELVNKGNTEAYFDDIRVHPFQSHMKSFVYDPYTQRLVAELDENNYATHYEYDDEGILIRVKKETSRGVMTIKETRNNQSKIEATEQ